VRAWVRTPFTTIFADITWAYTYDALSSVFNYDFNSLITGLLG